MNFNIDIRDEKLHLNGVGNMTDIWLFLDNNITTYELDGDYTIEIRPVSHGFYSPYGVSPSVLPPPITKEYDKLKHCPFCNTQETHTDHEQIKHIKTYNKFGRFWVGCSVCHTRGPKGNDELEAIALWNDGVRMYDNN